MQTNEMALVALIAISLISATAYLLSPEDNQDSSDIILSISEDPLIQGEGHDHMNASMHNMSSGNICLLYTSPSPRD